MSSSSSGASNTRQSVYLIVGTLAVFIAVAKIVGAENLYEPSRYAPSAESDYGFDREGKPTRTWPTKRPEPSPMFGSNDKSRWATIRSLVDEGTYVIGRRVNFQATEAPFQDEGIIFESGYQSLDKVMNPETGEFYSSKPPLLSTVLAGEYWLLKKVFGWDIVADRWWVICTILLTINVVPFIVYLWLMAKLIEQYGRTDFGRIAAFTLAATGTFLTTFMMTLNNHSPAAYCVVFALYPLLRNRASSGPNLLELTVSGFFAGLVATLDLPAAALTSALLIAVLIRQPLRALYSFLPAMLLPIGLFLAMNAIALGEITPAYAKFGGPWYEYPGSHWKKWELVQQGIPQKGIDFANETKDVYAFHMLFGHHGWFSLTPLFLLMAIGILANSWMCGSDLIAFFRKRTSSAKPFISWKLLNLLTVVLSIVVIGYYIQNSNNYGGFTSGPRWLFWLIPMWILAGLSILDDLERNTLGKLVVLLLLGFSVLSVFYPASNPWRPPWILQLCEVNGWVNYDILDKTQVK